MVLLRISAVSIQQGRDGCGLRILSEFPRGEPALDLGRWEGFLERPQMGGTPDPEQRLEAGSNVPWPVWVQGGGRPSLEITDMD